MTNENDYIAYPTPGAILEFITDHTAKTYIVNIDELLRGDVSLEVTYKGIVYDRWDIENILDTLLTK